MSEVSGQLSGVRGQEEPERPDIEAEAMARIEARIGAELRAKISAHRFWRSDNRKRLSDNRQPATGT